MKKPHCLFITAIVLTGGLIWWGASSGNLYHLFTADPPASIPVRQSKLTDKTLTMEEQVKKDLNETIIPRIDFRDDTVEECLDFLRLRHVKLSKSGGVSMIVREHSQPPSDANDDGLEAEDALENLVNPAHATKLITHKGTNLSVAEILDIICTQANLEWHITNRGLRIQPITQSAPTK